MPPRKTRYPEKPWAPDPAKWAKHLDPKVGDALKQGTPSEPKRGWMLYRPDTLEDVKQTK